MRKSLFALLVLVHAAGFAALSNTPNPKNLLIDQQDGTDVFAIPYDESNEDDLLLLKSMEKEQQEYFKSHPEEYREWLKTHPQSK